MHCLEFVMNFMIHPRLSLRDGVGRLPFRVLRRRSPCSPLCALVWMTTRLRDGLEVRCACAIPCPNLVDVHTALSDRVW